jgi:16S rRNA (cytosine1402-N4)-methyltransferase
VLLREAVDALDVRAGGLYLDATFGAGGHSREIVARGGTVVAFDVDPSAVVPADLADRVALVRANFAELAAELDARGAGPLDGALFDVGVSSMQFDDAGRGFSIQADGPVDMRMNPASGPSAYDLLRDWDERTLADAIYRYGEERASRRIARAIVAARERGELPERTASLAALVARAAGVRGRWRIHPATKTFQALRIAVNDELESLRRGLDAATERTRPGGRIAVVSFHSLEDRIVKQMFRDDPRLRVLTKKPVLPGEAEVARNARARSAKLRVAERSA